VSLSTSSGKDEAVLKIAEYAAQRLPSIGRGNYLIALESDCHGQFTGFFLVR
jgi:hypothetical protein